MIWCNEYVERLNDFRLRDVLGLRLCDVWPDNEVCSRGRHAVWQTGEPGRWLGPSATATGVPVWIDVTAQRTDDGLFTVCVDATAAVQLQRIRVIANPPPQMPASAFAADKIRSRK